MYEYNKVYQELADILNDKDVEKIYKNFRGPRKRHRHYLTTSEKSIFL